MSRFSRNSWLAILAMACLPGVIQSAGDDAPAAKVDLPTLLSRTEGVNVEGRPNNYELAEQARFYVWHDGDGWHVRTVGPPKIANGFRGTIRLHGTKFLKITPVGLDKRNDEASLSPGKDEFTFKFVTSNKFDGVDFNLDKVEGASIEFEVLLNGGKAPKRVFIGGKAANPKTNHFAIAVPK